MILKRFYDDGLAQASYLVGCAVTGEALVIDANRDIDQYMRAADAEGLRIRHVTETHIHADFVSGSRELASRAGAELYLSDEGDEDWKYAFAAESGARLLKDGDSFLVGNIEIQAVHTPGHTPEHLSFLLTDHAASDKPMGIFTGDFIFVGEVGRPDLLEKAANVRGTMEPGARDLFRSLQKFRDLPEYLQIWPAHGAGSACGKNLGGVPQSTVGYERIANWAFAVEDEDGFVEAILQGQPEPPFYFARMKQINKLGPPMLSSPPEARDSAGLPDMLKSGALVVDARSAADFAREHIPGTINIPLDRGFVTWAGWLISYGTPFYVILPDRNALHDAWRNLSLIGLEEKARFYLPDALESWKGTDRGMVATPQVTASELNARLAGASDVFLLDVRGRTEWDAGHLPGSINIPLGYLSPRLAEIPQDRDTVVYCLSGSRSSIAASLLESRGLTRVSDLSGGYNAWSDSARPLPDATRPSPQAPDRARSDSGIRIGRS